MLEYYTASYLTIGLCSGFAIIFVEATSCMELTLAERCIHAVTGTIFWLPLIMLFCSFLIYDLDEKIKRKKQEREKVKIFNNKFNVGQLVEINFLNTYRWRNTLGEAKLVELYYGHRACIPLQFEMMDTVMIDLKHITPINSKGGIIK